MGEKKKKREPGNQRHKRREREIDEENMKRKGRKSKKNGPIETTT
jgi:hypothetical protein